jgi:hypothetical protein
LVAKTTSCWSWAGCFAASNGHVLAFDDLSGLPPWLSDTLCRLTRGGAFSTRRLFTDQDEILFAAVLKDPERTRSH